MHTHAHTKHLIYSHKLRYFQCENSHFAETFPFVKTRNPNACDPECSQLNHAMLLNTTANSAINSSSAAGFVCAVEMREWHTIRFWRQYNKNDTFIKIGIAAAHHAITLANIEMSRAPTKWRIHFRVATI